MSGPGDQRSGWMDDIVQTYQQPLARYAARLVGDADRGRDIVQDTFVKLCDADPQQLNGKLAEWLYTVCRNRALDVREREARHSPPGLAATLASAPMPAPNPETVTERKETAASATAALATLPARQQEVVRLKFEHDLSYKQIAAVTGLSVTNVGYLIHTALKTIRQRLT